MRQIGYELTEKDKADMIALREKNDVLERAEVGLTELRLLSECVSSPKIDGMPKGQGKSNRVGTVVEQIAIQEALVQSMRRDVERKRKRVRRICGKLSGSFGLFCSAYYADCAPFDVAWARSGVKERQCYRYKEIVSGE